MSGKRWIFLWLPLSLLAAERDPFQLLLRIPAARRSFRNGAMAGRLGMRLAGRGFCRMGTESGDGYAWMSNCPRAGG